MTRKEQIKAAASAYTRVKCPMAMGGDRFKNMIDSINANPAFIAGAEWADKNPKSPWISVEEKLPEASDKFGRSKDVLILDENGWRTVAMYCIPENKWYLSVGEIQGDCEYPFEITHWMPIPELPKEE